MATVIEGKIEQARTELETVQQQYNSNLQQIQQLQQENGQLASQGNALASRINTLEELRAEGESSFREVSTDGASETEEKQVAEEVVAESKTL